MSTLRVMKITPRTGQQIQLASGTALGLSTSAFGGIKGTPVQMTYNRTDTRTSINAPNDGQNEITQTAIAITPKFDGSLIVLKWMVSGEVHQDVGFRIYKNGTLWKSTTQTNQRWGVYVNGYYDRNQSSTMSNWYINAFDTETEAGVENTYSLAVGTTNTSSYNFYLNRTQGSGGQNSYENGATIMTAMEITR